MDGPALRGAAPWQRTASASLATVSTAAGHVGASDGQVRQLAGEILARPQYAQWSDERLGGLVDLFATINRWLNALQDLSVSRPLLYAALLTGLFGVSLLLLAHVVISMRAALAGSRRAGSSRVAAPEPSFAADAEALFRAGQVLEATHQLELAVIALLLRRRLVDLSRSEPNRTLRLRLRDAPLPERERGELLRLIDRFEARWFRDRGNDPDLYAAWRALYDRLAALPQTV